MTDRFSRSAENGRVYLVGAGPGSPELLTLRAHALLTSASCVLHDDLVAPEIVALAAPGALVRGVGKRCGKKMVTQEEINEWLVQFAQEGHSVVRLKSGDPLLFGRAAEEIEVLRSAGIPFEIVPGISAGFAAAAVAGLPLTSRISTSRVLLATRHLAVGDVGGLAGIGPDAALVLYMPGRDYASIQAELIGNGWPPETHCIVASAVGTSGQEQVSCPLSELSSVATLPPPAVMLFFPLEIG